MIRNTNVQNVSLFKCLKSRSEKHLKIKREQRPIKPPMHEIRTHQHSLLKLTRTLVAKALGHNKHTQWDHVWEARPIENDQGSKEAGRRNESEHYQRNKTQQPDKPQRKRYSTFPHTETCRSTSAPNRAERRAKTNGTSTTWNTSTGTNPASAKSSVSIQQSRNRRNTTTWQK